jgi:hypothetical protein
MSLKNKVLAAAAALTVATGATAAIAAGTAGTASAATPSCGSTCIDIYSPQFTTWSHPWDVLDVYKQDAVVGAPIILFRISNVDPGEDFTLAKQGTVNSFYQAGLVSAAVNLHYGGGATGYPDFEAYEIQYSPYGIETGLCAGLASTAAAGTKVTLQSCGASSKTVWIADWSDFTWAGGQSVPLINGSTTNFSQPYVLTYPRTSSPSDHPRPQLYVTNLTGEANGTDPNLSSVDSNQLWWASFGPIQ